MFRSWRRIFPKFIDRIGCPTPDTGKICKMCTRKFIGIGRYQYKQIERFSIYK